MQAYKGADGVVISLTHSECEDMVSLKEAIESDETYDLTDDTFVKMMTAIAELKEVS